MTNNLNEQMREKAATVALAIESNYVTCPPTWLTEKVTAAVLAAITEAHAAGRQEILDRLPSTIDMIGYAGWLFHESDSNHIERRVGFVAAFNWLKSRLLGESK